MRSGSVGAELAPLFEVFGGTADVAEAEAVAANAHEFAAVAGVGVYLEVVIGLAAP